MLKYAYDIEVFLNLFTATFVNIDDRSEKKVFTIGFEENDVEKLKSFLRQEMILVGYNNHSYDDAILRYILLYKGKNILKDIYLLGTRLIATGSGGDDDIIALRYPKPWDNPFRWSSIDLMKIMAFDKLGISLKQTAINLKWWLIMDLPHDPTAPVHASEVDTVLYYNENDVNITVALYDAIEPIRKMREELSDLYGVNLLSASDSKMANILLGKFYSEKTGIHIKQLKDKRTHRDAVCLGECFAPFISFQDPELVRFYERLKTKTVYKRDAYKYDEKIRYGGVELQFGVGGLHSVDEPDIFESDDEYLIQDADVASYYPNLIINNNFYPEHLGMTFIELLRDLTKERIQAKKNKDKVKADGLKITINSIFGKLGSETFWLLDAKQMLSTTLSGQMGLLMLIEGFTNAGINVISCNTDGVICKIPRNKLKEYESVCKRWEEATGLELEFTAYKKYVRRDVNSYITMKENGEVKEKGAFLTEINLQKAYHMPIVAKALRKYFLEGVPIRDTITSCTDIMEFCISRKSDAKFQAQLHTSKGVENLQKNNRFYVSMFGGKLFMMNIHTHKLTGVVVDRTVQILNKYDATVPFEKYGVDFNFYIKETEKIIDLIEPKQLTLFDMSGEVRQGRRTKSDFEAESEKVERKELWTPSVSFEKVKDLPKKRFQRKIDEIVANKQAIDGIDPRYAYVLEYDSKKEEAYLFSFGRGTVVWVKLSKKVYNKKQFKMDEIIFCSKFKKTEKGFELLEYNIETKFKEIHPELLLEEYVD